MKNSSVSLALLCVIIALFMACENEIDKGNSSFNIVKVEARDLIKPDYEGAESASAVARGANDFAFKLSAELVKDAAGKNFVCSPYSVWLPLAALINAADDQSKAALAEALGAAGIEAADINKAASRMLYNLNNLQSKEYESPYHKYYNPLKIANAVFVDNNKTLRKDFAQTFMDYYRGASINVDFSSKDAADAVNRWASDNTGGLIKDIIKEFDPQTVMAIANAIYFSDRWRWEFNPDKTKEDIFHAPQGDGNAFFMLREGIDQIYYEDDKIQAMPLWFINGGGKYILLPRDGDAAALLSSMTNEYFMEIQGESDLAEGKLLLPRFNIENDIGGLKAALISLGVPLFEGTPLNGLIEEASLTLTSAMQKALIKVDEKGTTAAAVTVMQGATSVGPQPNVPFEMICDRPFVFILFGDTYDGGDQILFTGIVNRP
jgi:serpin B